MDEWQDGSKLQRFFSFPSLAKKAFLVALLIVFILTFLLGSELFARSGKQASERNEYSTPLHSADCATCHKVNKEGISSSLKLTIPELCLQCHSEIAARMKDAFSHEIFTQGKCSVCHVMHSPSADHLLRADISSLCGECHAEAARLVASGPHGQSSDSCLKCHMSHSSDSPRILRSEFISLCLGCHNLGPRGRNHPVGKGITDPLAGGELTCTSSCHHPHGSANERMLRRENGDGLCLLCHDMTVI